jgi:hypothetical protein
VALRHHWELEAAAAARFAVDAGEAADAVEGRVALAKQALAEARDQLQVNHV